MDILGLSLNEIYFAMLIAVAAALIALFATWISHRFDKQPGDRQKKSRRR